MNDAASATASLAQRAQPEAESFWSLVFRRFLRHRVAVVGLVILGAIATMALLAGVIAPGSPTALDAGAFQAAPSSAHLLGTDSVGRDVLSRLIYAARVSLTVGLLAVAMYVVIGTAVGAVAGYYGGTADLLLSRIMDVMLSFPPLIIILFAVSVFGRPSLWNVIIVLGLLGWPPVARLVRGQILAIRQQEFVAAATALGASDFRVVAATCCPTRWRPSWSPPPSGPPTPSSWRRRSRSSAWACSPRRRRGGTC